MDSGQRTATVLAAAVLLVCAWLVLRWNDAAIEEAFPTLSPEASESRPLREAAEPPLREAVAGEPAPQPAVETPARAPSASEPPAPAALEIRVQRDGALAPGIALWIAPTDLWPLEACLDVNVRAPDGAHSALTGATGAAVFAGIAPALYTLGLGSGPAPARVTRVVTSEFHTGYGYVVLLGTATVRGQVHDAEGRARAGAGILVRHRVPDPEHLVIAAITRTDAQGAYELGDFAAGSYEVVLEPDGRFDGHGDVEERRLEIEAGAEHVVDFGSPAGGPRWKGRVLNAFDEPFPGTGTLRLLQRRAGRSRSAPIDAAGRFELDFLPGTWELVVHASGSPGAGFELGPIVLPAGDLERDVVVPGARLAGRVVARDGGDTILAGLRVSAREAGHDYPAAFRTVETDADGAFRIDGLGPGTWVVGVYPGRLSEAVEVTLAPGERLVELELRWTTD